MRTMTNTQKSGYSRRLSLRVRNHNVFLVHNSGIIAVATVIRTKKSDRQPELVGHVKIPFLPIQNGNGDEKKKNPFDSR